MEDALKYAGALGGAAAMAAAATLYMKSRPTPLAPSGDLEHQAVEMPSGERISPLCQNGKLLEYLHEDCRTLHDCLVRGSKASGNGNCLGFRPAKNAPYTFIKYNEVMERAYHLGCGLMQLGLEPGQNTFVGIYAHNCVEWVLTEQACYYFSAVLVPLYDTLGPHTSTFIINQASIKLVVVDSEEKVAGLLAEVPSTPGLKTVVAVSPTPVSQQLVARGKSLGVRVVTLSQAETLGRENPFPPRLPQPQDVATVCYTSGTTGSPKGVVLTHGNIMAALSATLIQMGPYAPTSSDMTLSFLPLAHMLERVCELAVYSVGGCVGFFSGDIRTLMDDFRDLRPTITPSVPRLLNRIHDKVMAKVNSSRLRSWLFRKALQAKSQEVSRGIYRSNSLWDALVFRQVREGMGGRLRLVVCGSAPLASHVLTFTRCALGCPVLEGYGQTEAVAPVSLSLVGDPSTDHVGPPLACCAVRLVDVPEMEYCSSDGKGEVCIKGYNVFQGYLKDPEKTAEVLDPDGWLHTGDIGVWLPNNSLRIVDRKKHIFKLSQGEYIAPEKIENIYLSSKFVSQVFVHGESLMSCLVGIVCPSKEEVKALGKELGLTLDWKDLCENKEVKKRILDEMTHVGKKEGLKSFEQVKDIFVFWEGFTVENGLLTPTLKIKRPEMKKLFRLQIEAMYSMLA